MILEDSVQDLRLNVFRRAEELGNASAVCREAGASRAPSYRCKQRFGRYGGNGLHPKRTRARPSRSPRKLGAA